VSFFHRGEHKGPASPRARQDNLHAMMRAVASAAVLVLAGGISCTLASSSSPVKPVHPVQYAVTKPLPVVKKVPPPVQKKIVTYTVRRDENLWEIAGSHCGNGNDWHSIYDGNRKVISNWNLVQPGTVLVLTCGRN
jgi:nucleoid-associated protein YgaU